MKVSFEFSDHYYATCMVAIGALFQMDMASEEWPDGVWSLADTTIPRAIEDAISRAVVLLPLVEDSADGFSEWLSCLSAMRLAQLAICKTLDSIKHRQGDNEIFLTAFERIAETMRVQA